MYLKSLVLKGFKSFADRSVLGLEPGITAIVGPNGSGKSNISDAVLWVLGERNAKHLRGQAMEDVIFAGSKGRKGAGVAEVELVLDNSDGTLPVDYSEVVITRRMYRTGESEYLINGGMARRMDVLDILHDSGLGTGTHSIISQGNLDAILQSKPEDRRALIEEAAGILKHKQRKEKSQRKLEQMDNHLARVHDVVHELERQLGPLERKAKRAIAYREASEQLAEADLHLAVDDLRRLQAQWKSNEQREAQAQALVEQRRAAVDACEAAVGELQEKMRSANEDAGEISKRYRQASSAMDRIDSTLMVIRERRRSAEVRATELKEAGHGRAHRLSVLRRELDEAQNDLSAIVAQKEQAESGLTLLTKSYEELIERSRMSDAQITELLSKVRKDTSELEGARRNHARINEELVSGLARKQAMEKRLSELDEQCAAAQHEFELAQEENDKLATELQGLRSQEEAARSVVSEALVERDRTRAARDEAQNALVALDATIAALEDMEKARRSQDGDALPWLVKQAETLQVPVSPLVHALHVPGEYESLVETVLGADLAALIVDDDESACKLMGALGSQDLSGAVSLLMEHDSCTAKRASARAWDACAAYGQPLADALGVADEASGSVGRLLDDVVLCATLQDAFRGHAAPGGAALRFATPDGCIVWPSGKVSCGNAASSNLSGAISQARQLDESREARAGALDRAEEASRQNAASEEALRHAQESSLTASRKVAEAAGKAAAAENAVAKARRALEAAKREASNLAEQYERACQSVASRQPAVDELAQRIHDLGAGIDEANARISVLREQAAPLVAQVSAASDELNDARLKMATLSERLSYSQRMRDSRSNDLRALERSDANAQVQLAGKETAVKRLLPLEDLFQSLGQAIAVSVGNLERQSAESQDSASGIYAVIAQARTDAANAHKALDESAEALSACRVESGRLEVQVKAAVEAIEHGCEISLDSALLLPELQDREALEENAAKLRRRIASMGTINPDAAQEYEALKVRYDFLAGQIDDLDAARRSLAKIDRVIDRRMRDDFVETFETVDANFREIFALLFPGGNASLVLENPDDIEHTGVEVSAQPAGKRITKMMLMSGGEKSLTALALLFAVYRTRSTPFYILDEVEAALDDSNLRRLSAYIDTLRHDTQLIMITHQRRTMEMADVLFGVSMQADGVTKVISQKLDRALQYAE